MSSQVPEIEFAPFGSEENRRSWSTEIVGSSDYKVPRPSPKSIYRLADKVCSEISPAHLAPEKDSQHLQQYDVPALKTLALNHIRNQLTQCDIVGETFGGFASR